MPLWPQPTTPISERVRALHDKAAGQKPENVATAPATWLIIGEHSDYYGGITVVGLSDLQAAAAVSARTDDVISVTIELPAETVTHKTSLKELAELATAQQPRANSEGQPVIPPPPTGGLGERAAGMVWSVVGRQILSRETSGYDITVVSDIPPHAGMGGPSAMDAAIALALSGESDSGRDAPLRARLADLCTQVVTLFSQEPPLRARHTAALRGSGAEVTIIDYADGSVTTAPHPLGRDMRGFIVAVPGSYEPAELDIRARQRFIGEACQAFGADNLRLLPDASPRVIDWLSAFHQVNGPEGKPTVEQARNWLRFFEEETQRAAVATRALRSRRGAELIEALSSSQYNLQSALGLPTNQDLADFAIARGAKVARAASAGMANSVIALVPVERADNFAADVSADGLDVIELRPGQTAAVD